MITLIVARDRNGAIGRAGMLPWHVPGDLRDFRRETLGGALIMGRRTWESLPRKPLDGRLNCVISHDRSLPADAVTDSLAGALAACRAAGHARIYGIGGARVFADMLPLADRLLLTEMDLEVEGADTWFPPIDEADWHEIDRREVRGGEVGYTVRELMRARPPA